MRSLLFKTILLTAILTTAFALYILWMPEAFMPEGYVIWQYQKQVATGDTGIEDVETLIIGGSRPLAGINTAMIPKSRSLCTVFGTTHDAYFLLEAYLQHHPVPKKLVISVAPYRLMLDDGSFWHRTVGFGLINIEQLKAIEAVAQAKGQPLWKESWLPTSWKYHLYHSGFVPYYQPFLRQGMLAGRIGANEAALQTLSSHAGHFPFSDQITPSTNFKIAEARLTDFQAHPIMDHYLHQLLTLAEQKGVQKIVLATMPFSRSLSDQMTTQFKLSYKDYMNEVYNQHGTIILTNSHQVYPDQYFADPTHLNEAGKNSFTKGLLMELKRE